MKNLVKKIFGASNQQAISFLLCVLLAAFIWVVNALNNTHQTVVVIPIVYDKEISKNSTLALPPSIQVEVKGRGFALWNFSSAAKKYKVHTSYLSARTKDTVIYSKDAMAALLQNFSKDITVLDLKPTQLVFSGIESYSKKLAVKGNFNLSYQSPFLQSGPAVYYPDSVWVYSNEEIPATLTDIYAKTIEEKNITHTFFHSVALQKPFANYRLLQNHAWLLVPVDEGTEIQLDVPIQSKYGEIFIPSHAKVTCLVPMNKYTQTKAKQFKVYPIRGTGSSEKTFIQVTHSPYWASRCMLEPDMVRKLTKSFD